MGLYDFELLIKKNNLNIYTIRGFSDINRLLLYEAEDYPPRFLAMFSGIRTYHEIVNFSIMHFIKYTNILNPIFSFWDTSSEEYCKKESLLKHSMAKIIVRKTYEITTETKTDDEDIFLDHNNMFMLFENIDVINHYSVISKKSDCSDACVDTELYYNNRCTLTWFDYDILRVFNKLKNLGELVVLADVA